MDEMAGPRHQRNGGLGYMAGPDRARLSNIGEEAE